MKYKLLLICLVLIPINCFAYTDTSKSSIVMDLDSGRVLSEKNSDNKYLIASTTKIMTFLTSIELNDDLNKNVVVSKDILKMYGTNMYLNVGEELSIKDLLYGLMLRSGNDASIALAVAGSGNVVDFVSNMNKIAKNIGMNNTIYLNPHGLDEETKNYSSAKDLAILTRYLYNNYSVYKKIAGEKNYKFKSNLKSYNLKNRCQILYDYKYITTCKTGYTPLAGKSLVTTASKNKLNLLIVSINDSNHYNNQISMYDYYFSKYKKYKLVDKNKFNIIESPGSYIKNDYYYPLTKKEYNNITYKIIFNNNSNNIVTFNVYLYNNLIHEEPIYYKTNESKTSIIKRIIKIFSNN